MNISEQIFNELNTIIEKLKDPNISALEKEKLIKRKEDLTKRFSNHCKSGEVTPIKVLSSLTSEEEALEINYLIENNIYKNEANMLSLASEIRLKKNKESFKEISSALEGAKEKLDGRGK